MYIKTYQSLILSKFAKTFIRVSAVFFSLVFIISIFEELNFFKDTNESFFTPILLTFLNTPSVFYQLLPFIFLISTQFFFLELIEKNELLTFKHSGIKNSSIIYYLSFISLVLGVLVVLIFYNISSQLKHTYLEIKNSYSKDKQYLAVITENGLWIKDIVDDKINIINSEKINDHYLKKTTITQYDKDFNFIKNIYAEEIDIKNFNWIINNAIVSYDEKLTNEKKNLILKSNFNLERINNLFENLSSLTIWELYRMDADYKKLGYSLNEIISHKLRLFSFPIYLVIMTILSSILMLNIKYNKSKIYNLVIGIMLSAIIYYINYFINLLGSNGNLPVNISVLLPYLILSMFCFIGIIKINEK